MNPILLDIPVKPIAWKRPGYRRKTDHFYNQNKHDQVAFGLYAQQQYGGPPIEETPLHVDMWFYIPTKLTNKNGNKPVMTKPDLDNYAKFILDALSGIVYVDDRLVCSIFMLKKYATHGRIIIQIREFDYEEKETEIANLLPK